MKTIVLIADYGTDSLAVGEVCLSLYRHLASPLPIQVVASRPFNTVHTGFLLDQLQRHLPAGEGANYVFFLNTDPRTHTEAETSNAEGSPLYVAELANGVRVVTPNAGYCLSFVKGSIAKLWKAKCPADGTQFRSRDLFPRIVAAVADGAAAELQEPAQVDVVPDRPAGFLVLHTDNYGNIKTSFTKAEADRLGLSWGDSVVVSMSQREFLVPLRQTIFADKPGELVFAPGSSGDPADPCLELSVRYAGSVEAASAGQLFGFPEPGTAIKIEPAKR